MTIRELYAKYNELENKSEESVWRMFDENIKHKPVEVAEYIAVIRGLFETCERKETDEDGVETGFKYLNSSIVEVGKKAAMVFALTDLEGNEEGQAEDGNYYDLITRMGMIDYLWERNSRATESFQEVYFAEKEAFDARNGSTRYVNYYMKKFYDRFSVLADAATRMLDNMEAFDPEQLKEVQKVLMNMNESVQAVKALSDVN